MLTTSCLNWAMPNPTAYANEVRTNTKAVLLEDFNRNDIFYRIPVLEHPIITSDIFSNIEYDIFVYTFIAIPIFLPYPGFHVR